MADPSRTALFVLLSLASAPLCAIPLASRAEGPPVPATVADSHCAVAPSGLRTCDLVVGSGAVATAGARLEMHYNGWLADGALIDSTYARSQPFSFVLGEGRVIEGWEQGIPGMRVGGVRQIAIPYALAYGEAGHPPTIPPAAALVFEVQLVGLETPRAVPLAPTELPRSAYSRSPSGLRWHDFAIGSGETARAGRTVRVHYTGWLADGTRFDSSLERGEPLSFVLGQGQVIRGWDEGLSGMRVGGRRQIVIPHPLAYGKQGRPPVIPKRAALVFEVELLSVE